MIRTNNTWVAAFVNYLALFLPFVLMMIVGIVLLCVFPGIATWLPDLLMGPA